MSSKSTADDIRGLPRAFWILWAGSFVNRLGTFVVPFLSIFLTGERGFSYAQAGRIAALLGLGSVLAGPIGGTLADKLGRKSTLALGLSLGALFLLCILYARSPAQIACAVFFCGLGSDIFRPAMHAAISDVVEPAQRPRAFGLAYWSINLGFALAMPLGGALAASGYTKLFYADAGTNLMFAALILWGIRETRPSRSANPIATTAKQPPQDFRAALLDPTFAAFAGLMVLASLVMMQTLSSLPLAMREQGLSTAAYGELLSINGFLIVGLQPFAERVLGWMRPARRLALAIAIMGLGMGLQALCTAPLHYAFAIAVWTLGEIALAGIAPTVVAHLAPVHLRGAYQGVYGMAWSAGALLAQLTGPPLLAAKGPAVLWTAALAVGLLAAFGMLGLGTRLERAGTAL